MMNRLSKAPADRLPSVRLVEIEGQPGKTLEIDRGAEAVFGTKSSAFLASQVLAIIKMLPSTNGEPTDPHQLDAIVAMISSMKPKNEIEAALAVQIAATHVLSLHLASKVLSAPDAHVLDLRVTAATKFARTLLAQIDALSRMRRGGKQTVVVQHVHMNGGQVAVVGQVKGGGRGRGKIKGQSHAAIGRTLELKDGSALWREDPIREPVPVASREREDALPDARRKGRRTEGAA